MSFVFSTRLRQSLLASTLAPSRQVVCSTSTALHQFRTMSSDATTTPNAGADDLILSSLSSSGKVALLKLNRPKALNALSSPLMQRLNEELARIDRDDSIGAVVLTGAGERAFAAGADIKEMQSKEFAECYRTDFLSTWSNVSSFRKPIVGAVNGFCLGGGCELAMMCDILLASPTAVFGQPEINLGIIPGAGGTQRLIKAFGKSLAMEYILTGKNFPATLAESHGLISRIVPDAADASTKGSGVVAEALSVAEEIAAKGRLAVIAAKEAVNVSQDVGLTQGLAYERRLFQSLFATADQKEGMAAFANKRKAAFTNQ